MWLFALFLIIPLVEIALFITIGGWLTLWPTLALVLLTGIVGTALMRWQGLKVLAELRGDMGQLSNPLSPLAHGALIVVAGLLLLTPGFFTDTIGFLLMAPKVREAVIAFVGSRIRTQTFGTQTHNPHDARSPGQGPNVIDGEYFEVEENPPPKGPSGWTRH
ncbi:MAG: FxsA family protein [Paracoccaceae bacterium]